MRWFGVTRMDMSLVESTFCRLLPLRCEPNSIMCDGAADITSLPSAYRSLLLAFS